MCDCVFPFLAKLYYLQENRQVHSFMKLGTILISFVNDFKTFNGNAYNTSLAAPGALAHHLQSAILHYLQRQTSCKIQNGQHG